MACCGGGLSALQKVSSVNWTVTTGANPVDSADWDSNNAVGPGPGRGGAASFGGPYQQGSDRQFVPELDLYRAQQDLDVVAAGSVHNSQDAPSQEGQTAGRTSTTPHGSGVRTIGYPLGPDDQFQAAAPWRQIIKSRPTDHQQAQQDAIGDPSQLARMISAYSEEVLAAHVP